MGTALKGGGYKPYLGSVSAHELEEDGQNSTRDQGRTRRLRTHEVVYGLDQVSLDFQAAAGKSPRDYFLQDRSRLEPLPSFCTVAFVIAPTSVVVVIVVAGGGVAVCAGVGVIF